MNGALHTFRVRPLPHLVEHKSRRSNEITALAINNRREHTKSRRGCEKCKQRRKKCDERRPTCSLCAKKKEHCVYADANMTLGVKGYTSTPCPSTVPPSLWPGPRAPMVLTTNALETSHTRYDLYLIDHFVKMAHPLFEEQEYDILYASKTLDLAKEYPFLMHAMVALAACHLQNIGIDARCYRLPEAFHCHLASRGLRDAVSSINGVKDADSILATAMLLNCLTFCAADYREEELPDLNGPRWEWLRIQIGLTDLLIQTKPFHSESMWLPMFLTSDKLQITKSPQNDLGEQLGIFCGISSNSTPENNPYLDFFEQLAPLVGEIPSIDNVRRYINAVRGISSPFVDLLEAHDTQALLLFAHWAALMGVIGSWWSYKRIRRVCGAVCEILEAKMDRKNMKLLEIPRRACGRL